MAKTKNRPVKKSEHNKYIKIALPALILILIVFFIFYKSDYREIRFKHLDTDTTLIKEMKVRFNLSNLTDIYLADIYLKDFTRKGAENVSRKYLDKNAGKTQLIMLYMFDKDRNEGDTVQNGSQYYLSYLILQYNRFVMEDVKTYDNSPE